jgi:heme-degrading monooxygenase HmoA
MHVEVDTVTGDPVRLAEAISYAASEVRPALERQPGSLGTLLLIDPQAAAMEFASFWASDGALVESDDLISATVREAARRGGGKVTRERYEVPVFERDAPLRGGEGARVTQMKVEPSKLSNVEDAIAWYGDTVVPQLVDTSGFRAALLYADWESGTLVSVTVWQDLDALASGRNAARSGETAAAEALDGVIGTSREYRLVFSSARTA